MSENSTQKQTFNVVFDDGHEVVGIQCKSRDLARLESDGFVFDEASPIRGTYTIVHAVLLRMRANAQIDFDPPETVDDLLAVADIEIDAGGDAGGEGLGQVAATG